MGLDLRLAPMAGVTNAPFRLVARECGAGLLTSEEIDARALLADNAHTREIARHLPEEHPLAMQLLGADPDVLAEAARRLEAAGADAVDLNMGCPVPKIVAKGQGAALMRDPLRAALVFRAMRKALTVPLTIKIRGGWDDNTLNAVEIARIAEEEGVEAITVHPRTRSQQFSGRAPWDVIAEVVAAVALPVTGNGDVRSREEADAMAHATGCAAVMIGRGALGAPWVFIVSGSARPASTVGGLLQEVSSSVVSGSARPASTVGGLPQEVSSSVVSEAHRAGIIRRHCALIQEHFPERLALLQLKKHLAWYSSGRPFGARLRPALFGATTAHEVQALFWRHWIEVPS